MYFVTSVKICKMMIEVAPEQSRISFICMHTECCCRHRCCCCCFVCCYTAAVAAAAVLLLPAAVRHHVPDGQICCCFIESDPTQCFSSFKREDFLWYPLAVLYRIYGLDLPTSSVTTGMRGAKAGVSPPRRSPPCNYVYLFSPVSALYFVSFVFVSLPSFLSLLCHPCHTNWT